MRATPKATGALALFALGWIGTAGASPVSEVECRGAADGAQAQPAMEKRAPMLAAQVETVLSESDVILAESRLTAARSRSASTRVPTP